LTELPEEIGCIGSLIELNLRESGISSLPSSIWKLQNLMYILCTKGGPTILDKKSEFALACNRSRYVTGFGTMGSEKSIGKMPKLWPLVLNKATRAYKRNSLSRKYRVGCCTYEIPQSDAIYQLLMDGRESFSRVLINHDSTAIPTATRTS
jgi:hypothetical protein